MCALSARRKCLDYIKGIAGLWFSLQMPLKWKELLSHPLLLFPAQLPLEGRGMSSPLPCCVLPLLP